MNGYQCENCTSTFVEPRDLRQHYRLMHRVHVGQGAMYWPELSLSEIVRLTFWRHMRIEGWAFATEGCEVMR